MGKLFAFFSGGWVGWLASFAAIAAIVGGIWFGFHAWTESLRQEGRDEIQAAWNKDKQARALLAAAAAEEKRAKEAEDAEKLAKERADRERDAAIVGAVLAAANARDVRVQHAATSAARALQACNVQSSKPGADGPAETFRRVFEECRGELRTMGADAEGLASTVRQLQSRIGSALSVCGPETERPVVAEH